MSRCSRIWSAAAVNEANRKVEEALGAKMGNLRVPGL